MTDALVVHINRSTHHAIEPASERFETDGPFLVQVQNHGEGSHVHCSLTGELASAASVTEDNPFLEPDGVVEIPVEVGTDLRPARGTLEVSTGYGRESVAVDVLVRESDAIPTSPIGREESGAGSSDTGGSGGSGSRGDTGPAGSPGMEQTARSSGGAGSGRLSNPTERIEAAIASVDEGTVLLALLGFLAIAIAYGALRLLEGPAVLLAVLVVIATVIGVGAGLLRR